MSYVDLHLHLLPGVDDGAPDEAAALTHAHRLASEGVRDVTVTPHVNGYWPLDVATIAERV
ncbi:MAG TPA: CpsB/CapC family capsule biosynthesis tyrosine phosphatase, partial [Steroidobacteraceae bacterium]|nr:CpsB/CapC family capsule biosynthesis tyrosine phosphatase [Steroidobacteraceae bacterium]